MLRKSPREKLSDHFADVIRFLNPREFVIQTTVEIGHEVMVYSHESQDRRVQVTNVPTIDGSLGPKLVGLTVTSPPLYPTTSKTIGKSFGVVISSTLVALRNGLSTELPAPDDQGFVEQSQPLQIR